MPHPGEQDYIPALAGFLKDWLTIQTGTGSVGPDRSFAEVSLRKLCKTLLDKSHLRVPAASVAMVVATRASARIHVLEYEQKR